MKPLAVLLVVLMLSGCALAPYTPSPEERLQRQLIFTVSESPAPSFSSTFAEDDAKSHSDVASVVGSILNLHQLKIISQWSIHALGLKAVVAEIKGPQRLERVVQSLRRDGRVESVEPMKSYDLLTYNDPYFHMQTATVNATDIERIHALTTGRDVVVAVIDTGMDRNHPELADNIIQWRNFVAHDQGFDEDEHGTSVAGVIGSAANNDLGIVGVAPDAKLMAYKACWQDSQTRKARCDSVSIIKALVETLKQHPDVVNLSLSGPADPLIAQLLEEADNRGIIVVAAIDPRRRKSFPASLDSVIGVNAPTADEINLPRYGLLAPGTDILTTAPGATYAFRSGSSMASAYVSGVAALLKERQPTLSTSQLTAHLRATARSEVGAVPVVDICAAVSSVVDDMACPSDSVLAAH